MCENYADKQIRSPTGTDTYIYITDTFLYVCVFAICVANLTAVNGFVLLGCWLPRCSSYVSWPAGSRFWFEFGLGHVPGFDVPFFSLS